MPRGVINGIRFGPTGAETWAEDWIQQMIRKWRVKHFKSLTSQVELEWAPLTILAGANSSGKSSLLQSMLLLGQTSMSKLSSRALILNGPLTRLGSFDDIRSFDAADQEI